MRELLAHRLQVGDIVELLRARPYGERDSIVRAQPGDRGRVVRAGRHGCAVDFNGAVCVVLYEDVVFISRAAASHPL